MSLQSEEIGQIMAVSPDTVFAGAKNRCVPSKAQHGMNKYTVVKGGLPMSEQGCRFDYLDDVH